jgi:hypothetical protein
MSRALVLVVRRLLPGLACRMSCWPRRRGFMTSGMPRTWRRRDFILWMAPGSCGGFGADDRLARLVAHHSCAVYEARVRGLERELVEEFESEQSVTADALVFCDLTTAPDGRLVAFGDRMDEIEQRYGPDHDVTQALHLARPDLTSCCQRTLARLADQSVSPM